MCSSLYSFITSLFPLVQFCFTSPVVDEVVVSHMIIYSLYTSIIVNWWIYIVSISTRAFLSMCNWCFFFTPLVRVANLTGKRRPNLRGKENWPRDTHSAPLWVLFISSDFFSRILRGQWMLFRTRCFNHQKLRWRHILCWWTCCTVTCSPVQPPKLLCVVSVAARS